MSDLASAGDEEYVRPLSFRKISAAPEVDTSGMALDEISGTALSVAALEHLQDAKARRINVNVPYEQMHAPVAGPQHPLIKDHGIMNSRGGHVEDYNINTYHFDDQYSTFNSLGYGAAPEGTGYVGDDAAYQQHQGEGTTALANRLKKKKTAEERAADAERRRQLQASADPGATWSLNARQPWALKEAKVTELTDEQKEFMAQIQKEKDEQGGGKGEAPAAKSHFHGKELVDYAGRSWIEPPRDKHKENDYAFLPKRHIHTWSGHSKGVNAIRFFPEHGHLLLSAGLDGKIKIWDVFNSGKCMRDYLGFSKGVKGIEFSNDGKRFLSTSYDRVIKLWDTETGQVITTLGEGKMWFVAKFHPDADKQNVVLAGCSDKKVYQWDMNTGDLVQEYDYHLGAVNTITFVDEGRRFVTTSDDKTIRVWEYGIPVQIKYIADPGMHSIPAVTLHPNKQWFIGQSLDNQIVTYSTKDRFRQNRKKTFKGHTIAGYACRPNFAPDGRYVISGDGEGRCWFWDWKSTKSFRTIKAHDGVCIDTEWHPLESSKVATAGWDGLIKYWD
ncbi:hypothetical protein WJX84_004948 [Apatococcus fuscideae]|uniref:Pre-mRNA-processing factor 17 n=1 Tax=Apatococcus fuscideae TaxID=2026836 RepID=A0AAW1SQA0_9CHLO